MTQGPDHLVFRTILFHQLNRIEIAIGILNDFFEVLELKVDVR